MDLSIIIVNWKVKDLVKRLVDSIFRYTKDINFEIIVVDNDSGDGSVELLLRSFPNIKVIASDKNLGFAGGCNKGIEVARSDFILLLNPDTEIFDDSLMRLVHWMRAHPEAGIGSGKVLNPDHTIQRDVRRFPTIFSQFLIVLKLHHLFKKVKSLKQYFARDFDYEKEQEVDQVIGAFFCIRRSVIEKIGLLDDAFFVWFEEVDFCKRTKEAGFKIIYTPKVSVIHHGGESFAQVFALKKQRYYNASLRTYSKKHFGFLAWLLFTVISPLSLLLAWLVGLLKIKPKAYVRKI